MWFIYEFRLTVKIYLKLRVAKINNKYFYFIVRPSYKKKSGIYVYQLCVFAILQPKNITL